MARDSVRIAIRVWFALCLSVLVWPAFTQAAEVSLDKPVELKAGKGMVIFSLTVPGAVGGSNVEWRKLGKYNTNIGEEHSGEVMARGGLVGLELPPGTYEFYDFFTMSADQRSIFSAKEKFSRQFTVVPGKIRYIGNLDVCIRRVIFTGADFLELAFGGRSMGTVEVLPSLLDKGDVDLPLLFAKNNGLKAGDVERDVVVGAADQHMLDLANALHSRAEQGDGAAAKQLLSGLLDGWSTSDTGEEFKVLANPAWQQQLGEQLAAQGVPGGAYALGLLKLAALQDKSKAAALSPADGKQALDYFIADAERYVPGALEKTVWIYNNGILGVPENKEQRDFWEKRMDGTQTLSAKAVPYLGAMDRLQYARFLGSARPRYCALSVTGAFGMSKGEGSSAKTAIAACEKHNGGAAEHCRLYAESTKVDWDACPADYVGPEENTFPPATGLGDVADSTKLPGKLKQSAKSAYYEFLATRMPRAFAVSDSGEAAMASGDCHAAYKALQKCHELSGKACRLYAMDDQIVLGATDPKLVEEEQRLVALVEKNSGRPDATGNAALPDPGKLSRQSMAGGLLAPISQNN